MNGLNRALAFTATLSLLGGAAQAATNYYVDSNAATGGNGTSGSPWKTLTQAKNAINSNQIVPGDTILCRGNFVDVIILNNKGTTVDAQAGRYITFANWGSTRPKLEIPNNGDPAAEANRYNNAFDFRNCYGMAVEGFEIIAHRDRAIDSVGINAGYSYFLRFKNNEIHECGESGIQTLRSGKILIEKNKCWNNSWSSTYNGSGISVYQNFDFGSPGVITNPRNYQNIIRDNACWGNANFAGPKTDGNGIIVDDTRNLQDLNSFDPNPRHNQEQTGGTLVENNICTANGARGINVFSSSYAYVINNTCHDNATVLPRSGAIVVSWSKSVVLKNNIAVARTGQNAIEVVNKDGDPLEYPTIQNCLIYNGPVCTLEGRQVPVDTSNVIGDPKFTNPSIGDYTLQSSSPAIDIGNLTNTFTNDINGNLRKRGNAVDAGAHESAFARTYPAGSIAQYIEAESASTQGNFAPFSVVNDAGASGGKYITSTSGSEWYNQYQLFDTPGLGTNQYHRAEYGFSLVNQTTVNLWLRVRRVNWTGSVLFASIDSGISYADRGQFEFAYFPSYLLTNPPDQYLNETNWSWVLYRKVKLASGSHTFKLAKGLNNVQVDRIFVTSNLTATP